MEPTGDLQGLSCREEEEGEGEERTGDVDAGVSPSPSLSGENVSISALSVQIEQGVAGEDITELAVSTPESTDSERRFDPTSEEGVGRSPSLLPSHSESNDWPPSVTQASMRFPKLLYRFISPLYPHTSAPELQ